MRRGHEHRAESYESSEGRIRQVNKINSKIQKG